MDGQDDRMDASTVKKLANRVRACTFLPYVGEADWTDDVTSAVEEFVARADRRTLCLFYENGALKATFRVPGARTDAFAWFLKSAAVDGRDDARLDEANFSRRVSFGKVDTPVEKTMFLLLDSLYSPFVFSWTADEKDRFFEQYRAVVQELCSLRYKFLGMPSIYVPTIVGGFDETSKGVSEETLRVLENIISVYTLEIQKCLMDNERVPSRCEYMTEHIVDEIDYWQNRLTNLRFITTLLSYKSVDEILTILKQHESIIVHSFDNAVDEIETAKTESESNVAYLRILREPVMSLYDVKSPDDVLTRLPDIFSRFVCIFEESPYYNERSDVSRLFEYLGNQIVFVCRKTVKMSELFAGNTESVLDELRTAMDCCENYIAVSAKAIDVYNCKNDGHWSLETRDVRVFLDRCEAVKYVCKSMALFKRWDGSRRIPRPKFPFAKGLEFEKAVESIESRFDELIANLENVQNVIFNVNSAEWYQHEFGFKCEIKELCAAVEQLLDDSLSVACNVEDALNVLQSLHYFSGWPQLCRHLKKKTDQVYGMLVDDIAFSVRFYTGNGYRIPSPTVRHSGVCIAATTEYKRITALVNMISERYWLLPCANVKKLRKAYRHYTTKYRELMTGAIESWSNGQSDFERNLDKHILMGNQNDRHRHLTTNLDCDTFDLVTEIECWPLIGFGNILRPDSVVANATRIKRLHRDASKIVDDYNALTAGLSRQEMSLFGESIESCNKITSPMIRTYTWTRPADIGDGYLLGCFDELQSFRRLVDEYKRCNVEIVDACEDMANMTLFKMDRVRISDLKDLRARIETIKSDKIMKIFDNYNQIVKYVMIVYEGFEDRMDNIAVYWRRYVEKIDSLICEALILNCRRSLENFLALSVGDGSGPIPVISIRVSLKHNKIEYCSSLSEILAFAANFSTDMLMTVRPVPRLSRTFKLPENNRSSYGDEISKDRVCVRLQENINTATINALRRLTRHMRDVLLFEDIWSTDKKAFFERYKAFNPSAAHFNQDITRYSIHKRKISGIRPVAQVAHFLVRMNVLKDDIVQHCDEWINNFFDLLLETTTNLVEGFYRYVRINSLQAMTPPKNLTEMISFVELREKIVSEYDDKAKEFTVISDNVKVLEANNIRLPEGMETKYEKLFKVWSTYRNTLEDAEIMLKTKQNEFMNSLMEKRTDIKIKAKNLSQSFLETAPISTEWKSTDALNYIEQVQSKLAILKTEEKQLFDDLAVFEMKYIYSIEMSELQEEISVLHSVWKLVDAWDGIWRGYKATRFWTVQASDAIVTVDGFADQFDNVVVALRDKKWEVIETTRNNIDEFRCLLPVIDHLKNPAMKARHWDEVRHLINKRFDETDSDRFTLENLMEVKIQNFSEQISDISKKSTVELGLENAIKNIKETWSGITLRVETHKDKGIYRVHVNDDIFQSLEDHLMRLSAIKTSKHISVFLDEADFLEKSLGLVMEVLEIVLSVQRQRIYLENVFTGDDDIRQRLPIESIDFDILTEEWKEITVKMYEENNLFKACHSKCLFKHLNTMNHRLEVIQRALEVYMESKRHVFPRFYFISNWELLEVLGNSKNPDSIRPHLKKLFDNIHDVKILTNNNQKKEARGMFSGDGEYVDWHQPVVVCDGPPEIWFSLIESAMRDSLRRTLKQVKTSLTKNSKTRDKWISEWPGQLCIVASQIRWTADCTRALLQSKNARHKYPLKRMYKKQTNVLTRLSRVVRTELDNAERSKVTALIVTEAHARDVIEHLYRSNCTDACAFEWTCQLRFYWDRKTNDVTVRQTDGKQSYGYEYSGNSGRLVITPLTDRCYVTMTAAVHAHRGGHLRGLACTGKTETVKDLGKHLARYVVAVDCSETWDCRAVGRVFSGLAQQGAWGCFDGIGRWRPEVLSSAAQHVLSVFAALAADSKTLLVGNDAVALAPACGLFVTTRPGGGRGGDRSDLPDGLRSSFRAVSMTVPDRRLVAETVLFAEGFKDAKNLAARLSALLLSVRGCGGLRGLVELIRRAGKSRRENPKRPDDEIVLAAARETTGWLAAAEDDRPMFADVADGLFADAAPSSPASKTDGVLVDAIRRTMLANNRRPTERAVSDTVRLYETKKFGRAAIIVGRSGAAKSATWRTLRDALILLHGERTTDAFQTVIDYVLNPTTLTIEEMYGVYDRVTHEWMDGVLSSIVRKACSDDGPEEKWVIFDGPIDNSGRIEHLNSAMDDSKMLILANGERIPIPQQVSFVFEVDSLEEASPATVSRCGVVYNDHNDYGWRLYVHSWLDKCKFKPYKDSMTLHFDQYVGGLLAFKKSNCVEPVSLTDQNCVISLCKLLECCTFDDLADRVPAGLDDSQYRFLVKIWFIFCMIWSVCSDANEDGKKKIDVYVRGLEDVFPVRDTVYHYYVDNDHCKFKHWEEKLAMNKWKYNTGTQFSKIIVPTIDTVRHDYLIQLHLSKKQPILLAGPRGCGKTLNANNSFKNMNRKNFSFLNIHMNAQTTSNDVQEMIEEKLEKRTKQLYVPLTGKTMVAFLDDIHMPIKETCGAQPSLELIRQWVDYGFWYDKKNRCPKYVKNMLLVCAMTLFDRLEHCVSDRVMRCFSVINIKTPEENDIYNVYATILGRHLTDFDETVSELGNGLTSMTISLYKRLAIDMIATPVKIHYSFGLRDISKVFQGLLRSNVTHQNFKVPMLRLWCHEAFRVFHDRLVDENDRKWFLDQINQQLESNYNLTYRDLCTSENNPIFCSFLNENTLYEEAVDDDRLKRFIEDGVREYNSSSEFAPVDILLFRDCIEHVCRIVRVISQPTGHVLLIGVGGSGRSSLGKIASWLCKYGIFTIEMAESYGTSEFKKDLKLVYSETGIKNRPTSFVFKDTQIVDDSFLKIINNILSTGEVTKLFNENEFEQIKNTLIESAKCSDEMESTDVVNSLFIDRIKNNLHFILSFSPIQKSFRTRLRQYPALINFTTIDWFSDWPKEALIEVASTSLGDFDVLATITGEPRVHGTQYEGVTRDTFKNSLSSVFASIHRSVIEYSKRVQVESNRTDNVTHAMYLEMISGYKEILREKRIEKRNASIKLRNGLRKINDTSHKINDMTTELENVAELIATRAKECEQMFAVVSKYIVEIDEQKNEIDSMCMKVKKDELKCQEMYDLALSELRLTIPELEEATNKICALNKKDLSEIKRFSVLPEGVKLVLEAVMTLKQSDTSWAEAKRQLDDPSFLNQLTNFDKDHVTDDVFKQIDLLIRNPEFDLEKIGTQSTAAKYLGMWVIAIEKYAKMYRSVTPKRTSADLAMATVKDEQIALGEAERKLTEKQTLLEKRKLEYDETVVKKEYLIARAEELKNKLEKSSKLIDELSKEKTEWNNTVNQIDVDFDYLPGDCVLSTAFVSYMGPFTYKCRGFLMDLWSTFTKENGAFNNPNFDVTLFLTDPATVRKWNVNGLSDDRFSLENGIIISRSYRHAFIIDPQNQAWKWIENIESDNGLKIIDYRSTNSTRNLETALQNGYPTLMQIDFENIDPRVVSILSNSIVKQRDQLFVRMGNKLLPYNEKFRIFMTTKIKNARHTPEIVARTVVVDFTVQQEGLEEQLLKTLLNIENPGLEELKDNTIISIEKDKKSLVEIQDGLIELLDESERSLLENDQLLQTLRSSKATFNIVKEQLQCSLTGQAEIHIAREGYRPCAKRASVLYFILDALHKINPMYQYSLDYYIAVFENSIKKSNAAEQLHERITNLNDYHTYAVYENVCRGLFERHKLPFAFQICMKILISENVVDTDEFEFLLDGGVGPKSEKPVATPCPDWLPTACWNNILALSNLPGFREVDESFERFSTEWRAWYLAPEPENLELVGQWENKCSLFQRVLFVRSLRLDRLSFSIEHFISKNLGPRFSEAPILNFKTIHDDLNNKNSMIFILSSGIDPKNMLLNMAKKCNKEDRFRSLSLGNGLESIAADLIETGQKEGGWVFLENCHLLLSWMPRLDKIIENMRDGRSHPDFRLWFSSKPHPRFPITLLQNAIKVSADQPKNLKSNLSHLYRNVDEGQFTQNESSGNKYKQILFNLCFFHCVLVERNKFQNLGWNETYEFGDSDFKRYPCQYLSSDVSEPLRGFRLQRSTIHVRPPPPFTTANVRHTKQRFRNASENVLSVYLDEYEDTPWTALKYMIGNICYGGHVTDIWDRRLLETYADQYFDDDAIPASFHKLSSPSVCVPENGSLQSYKDFIDTLPRTDPARTFGQHPNASAMYLTKENRSLCETLRCLQVQSDGPSADDDDKDKQVLSRLSEIRQNIPPSIGYRCAVDNVETGKNILDVTILQEVNRYNNLLKDMRTTLTTLEKGITGLLVMPSDVENTFQAIYESRVPGKWLKTYPSTMDLGAWTRDLIERVRYFTIWTSATNQQPVSTWLGAFTCPTGFLTRVLLDESKHSTVRMDVLGWDFIPVSTPSDDLTMPPDKGVYVRGLYLEGAGWDDKNSCLREPLPLELTTELPVMHFLPVEGKRRLKDLYQSPVYYCPKRNEGTRDGGDSSVVVLNLKSGSERPDHWIKRATAVLLNLGS